MNELINGFGQLYGIWSKIGVSLIVMAGVYLTVKHFFKKGTGKALAAAGGAIIVSVVLSHIVAGINYTNDKVSELPDIGRYANANINRGW
jgi:hypothetical protein